MLIELLYFVLVVMSFRKNVFSVCDRNGGLTQKADTLPMIAVAATLVLDIDTQSFPLFCCLHWLKAELTTMMAAELNCAEVGGVQQRCWIRQTRQRIRLGE